MHRDQIVGWTMVVGAIALIAIFGYLLFGPVPPEYTIMTLKIVVMAALVLVLGILAWIGYTLATTPPPKPIEEIEKEIEEELKKLEQESQQKQEQKT